MGTIFQRFQLPEKLNDIIEGESLFNDATAIVAFVTIASLALGHSEFKLTDTLGRLAWTLGTAIPVGLILGWGAAKLILAYRGVPAKGEAFHSFWNYLSELATGMLFFILGVTAGQHNFPLTWAIPGIILF